MPFIDGPLDDEYTYTPPWKQPLIWVVDLVTSYRVVRVPLLNWGIIVVYLTNLLKLSLNFRDLYNKHALGTTMLTNLLLYGLADTIAQTLRSAASFAQQHSIELDPAPQNKGLLRFILEKGRPRRVILDEEDDDLVELGLGIPQPATAPTQPLTHPEIFNFKRLALFSCWGLIISFFQSPWYAFLNATFGEGFKFVSVLQRVLSDQLFYSPISLACFLSYMTVVLEGGDSEAVKQKLMATYIPTLGLNYTIWPAAQFFNFLVVPEALQIPFSSIISVFWNAYLSLTNPS